MLSVAEATERRVVERDEDENQRLWTVLIVEDTPDVIRIVHLALRQHFKVLAAPDGLKGLELALRERPSLIITDLMMPGIDGFELVRRLRADATTKHIPVIMLTARGATDDKVMGLESGVNAYLTKPFSPRELLSTARALLDVQETQAELLLTRQMDSLETLTGGLAHEINNPLNYIRNAVARLQIDVDDVIKLSQPGAAGDPAKLAALAQRTRKMADTAEAGVRRIQATVDLMGRYSREGYSRLEREHDVWQAIADVVEVVRPAVGRTVEVVTDLPGAAVIRCVPEELHQALSNLIQNAIEAAPDGTGRVEISGSVDARHLTLRICDNGPGIPEADRQRIFQPFFSTKGPGRGMGMGLTITRQVVAALGGQIRVDPVPTGGTCFEVRLPLQRARISQPL
ncbi:MAG: hybrid sensor histidine kinase/response regulator [Deltaproteobacteria bacterium]|nr:hybrid sensor histidine kinase/response regulator [Deltaproteobacteria bacterium]